MRVRHVNQRVARGGGPQGYLFNLQQASRQLGAPSEVQIEVSEVMARPASPSALERLRRLLFERTPGLRRLRFELLGEFALRFEQAVRDWKVQYQALERSACLRLFACDLLFAHETFLAERLVRLCPRESREKLVLMTHAPTFYAHQLAGDTEPDSDEAVLLGAPCVERLRAEELEVMQAARAVVWPSVGAQEGYRDWKALYDRGAARSAFVATGVPRPEARETRETTRRRWQIEAWQRVALFMGRPHPHKGFDRFVAWANWSRSEQDDSWVFVFAGKQPRRSRRELGAVRCVGYQEDNGAAYAAADLVVFPNRYSYLDIGLLEALSVGAAIATTATGGHAELLALSPDLLAIRDGDGKDAWPALRAAAERAAADPGRAERQRELWEQRFSLAPFARGHAALARQLLEGARA